MALKKSLKSLSTWLFAPESTFDGGETPQFYLKLSIKVLEDVQAVTSPRVITKLSPKFNVEQCQYLAAKLEVAVEHARSFLLEQLPTWLGSEDMAKCLETNKLLFSSAKQVLGFINSCSRLDAHSIATVVLPNGSEHISSVEDDLELCRVVFSGSRNWETAHNVQSPLSLISTDREALVADLKTRIDQPSASDDAEHQLAIFLLRRLKSLDTQIHGSSSEPRAFEVDCRCLQPNGKLGSGGTCVVYKGIWMGASVAMKTFIGPNHPIFKKEVETLARVSHPNVLSLLCSSIDNRRCVIVTELMDEDLFSLIQTKMGLGCHLGTYASGPFSDLESVHIMLQVAKGMLYLHQKRIAHRDLKSNNILVKQTGGTEMGIGYMQVKVADFGLSKIKESSSTFSNETPNVGTSRWMAPEAMRVMDRPSTSTPFNSLKTDVYSFAIVCYEIVSGYVPFSTIHSVAEVKDRVLLGERPILPRQCPGKLKDLIERCWANEASERPTFDIICQELKDLKYSLAQVRGSRKQDKCASKPSIITSHHTSKDNTLQQQSLQSQQRPPSQRLNPKRRLSFRNSVFYCNFTSIDEIQLALLKAGLEDSSLTLIFGIDFSRASPDQHSDSDGCNSSSSSSLHAIGSHRNPYEKVMSILGRTLLAFDDEKLIPCFGFGDAITRDKHVFSFNLDHHPCEGSVKALARYRAIAPHIHLGESTSLSPVINTAVDIVQRSGGKHHVLVIISDGGVRRTGPEMADGQWSPQQQATMEAIVNASSHPLSMVLIGVGDGPWDTTCHFIDTLPPRRFENFHFVNFAQLMQRNLPPLQNVADFALAAVMEIPRQYRAILELGLLGKPVRKSPGRQHRVLLPPKVLQRDSPRIIDCPVCLSDRQGMTFNCTHRTCHQCSAFLQYCPMCRQAITTKIPLR